MTDDAIETEYVYAIGHPEGFAKIGRSKNPQKRLESHQTSSPYNLWLIAQIPASDSRALETELHDSLEERHVRGEWFELNFSDLDNLVELMRMCQNGGTIQTIDELDTHRAQVKEALR